ncbi:MAG: hypothetical protein ACI4NV_05715 [Thermoguttaceae bacterium]
MAANKTNNSKTPREVSLEYLSTLSPQEREEFVFELLQRLQNEAQSKPDFAKLDPPQGSVISSADDDFDDEEDVYELEEPEPEDQTLASADDDVDEEFDLEDDYDD